MFTWCTPGSNHGVTHAGRSCGGVAAGGVTPDCSLASELMHQLRLDRKTNVGSLETIGYLL